MVAVLPFSLPWPWISEYPFERIFLVRFPLPCRVFCTLDITMHLKATYRLLYLSFAILQLSWLSSADITTCYTPNGTSFGADNAKICNSLDGTVSMCCAQADDCLNNGLCKVAGDESLGIIDSYWRDMCSLSSWPEIGCLKACEVREYNFFSYV